MQTASQKFQAVLDTLPQDQKPIAAAIYAAFSSPVDELALADQFIEDLATRRFNPFDVIYVDLSIDRSTTPLEISGAGMLLSGLEATDNNATCTVSLNSQEPDTNRRYTIVRGKRLKLPFNKFYIYHSAQSGKYIKLLRCLSMPSFQFGVEDDSGADANSDLVTALGNSSTFSTGQATVDTTAGGISIIAANTSRKRVTLTNIGSTTVFIRVTAPTTANGHALPAGASITLNTTAAIKGIVSAGSAIVTYLEE